MQIIHHRSVDLAQREGVLPLDAVQGDGFTRAVEITLLENGAPWAAPPEVTAAVAFRKADGNKGLYDTLPDGSKALRIDGGTVTAVFAPQVLSCPGQVSAAVVFYGKDLQQLATFPFTIRVAANPAAGKSLSNDYYRFSTMEDVSRAVEAALQTLEDKMAETAPAIVCEAVGKTISVTDAANHPLGGLTLYGKTIQNGTPTPENPVELVSVGKSGSIKTTVCGRNLWAAAPLSPALDTTVDEDGYITITNNTSVKQYPSRNLIVPTGNYTITVEVASKHIEGYVCKDTMDYSNQILSSKTVKLVNATKICTQFAIVPNETIKFRITVNAGNTAFPYEPYKEPHTVTALTPNGLCGIPVASGGNYTDEQGQQWLCDEVDFARGVYARRVGSIASYAGQEIATAYLSTTGELSAGASVLYALAEPVETPLSAEELAQYAALRTHKPNTTVFNDSGAGMQLGYVADTKRYIDNRIAALSAAILA